MPPRRTIVATVLATLAALGFMATLAAFAVVQGGLYDVSALRQHWKPAYAVLERAMEQSVRRHARQVQVPPLDDRTLALRGAACFRDKCVQCHGAPGVAQSDIGQSMQPLPGPLIDAARRWEPRELYWVTREGIRMSGMPAWEMHLSEEEIWSVVAFLQQLPHLSVQDYRQAIRRADAVQQAGFLSACGTERRVGPATRGGDVEQGRKLLYQKACNACHVIPGITGSETHVGPPLGDFGRRDTVAGVLPNTSENLARWLREPDAVKPGTAMPAMGLSAQDALDIAAYLAALR
ncbi:c-type cytochrome [Xylophilus sp. GOD-11R]|uniref:c-type cytochrome n=1 Tax=Xylophilus sp. GOD-11R TaxID=3089814 RepID=UPI00298C9ECF|nr:c-type cytochrome [Xylophilus sp. GOD-11R]WPB55850.1 c-type cytochrome [Xylophilus sp. GOD-11R]